MTSRIENIIKSNYNFSDIKNFRQEHLGGLMNENYSFESSHKKYFVKLYKHYTESKVVISHALIKHLTQKGVSSYEFVENKYGSTSTKADNHPFEISVFITDVQNGINFDISETLVKEMAQGLADYHLTVSDITLPIDFVNVFDPQNTKKDFLHIKEKIIQIGVLDDFDRLCMEMLDLKLRLIEEIPTFLINIKLDKFPILVNHGDFLTGNCLFNNNQKIKYIIDFEHIVNTYRIWDLIKMSAFLSRKNKHEIFHSEISIDLLAYCLKQYHHKNPLTLEEIEALPSLYVTASVLSDFVLYGYYLADNPKAKSVASKDKAEWTWWIDNHDLVRTKIHKELL